MDNKFDIKSSTIDKGLEIAKNFVDKLVMPTIEESGLLVKDQITMWRFKNQIKMLNKAQEYCLKHNINPKKISLKVLSPLLDYSSLEEDDFLTDKYAILLSNLVDSEQNIQNHVFPYIISQISKKEFQIIEYAYNEKHERTNKIKIEIDEYEKDKDAVNSKIQEEIKDIDQQINNTDRSSKTFNYDLTSLYRKKSDLQNRLNSHRYRKVKLSNLVTKLEEIVIGDLENFEISNLIRLGLVKEEKEFYADSQPLKIPNERYSPNYDTHTRVDLEIEVHSAIQHVLTEFGEIFIKSCKEKSNI